MKQFLKFTFASCLGTFFAIGLLFFFLFAATLSTAPQIAVADNSVLHLKFDKPIPELTDNVQQGQFGFSEGTTVGLNDITRHIRNAATDPKISGIFLQPQSVAINPTTAYSIAREIADFKESGKFVYAYGDYFTQSGYILAVMADSVFLNPNGLVDLRGYGMTIPYFEDFSEKTGIDFDVYHAGKYKSAIEPYYRGESSPENRYQTRAYLQDYHNALAQHIATYRDVAVNQINYVISGGLSNNSDDALAHDLTDGLRYPEDVEKMIEESVGVKRLNLVTLDTYHQAYPKPTTNNSNKVAIIYAEGEVASGGDIRGVISMDVYDDIFDRIEKNNKIGAVVLRINSPGGSSFTSDRFYKRINDLKKAGKYVVASFGDYAASGGYYIAAGADKIISEPTTLTGSIGVFSMMPDMNELSSEKLGIYWDTIGTGRRTFLYSQFVSRSDGDNALLMSETERVYRSFKKIVAAGRDMAEDEVQEVAQGRVWSGDDALHTGLIDTIGSMADAIDIAATAAGYDDFKILEYPIIEKEFWEQMIESITSASGVRITEPQGPYESLSKDIMASIKLIDDACKAPQARMPFSILVN